MAGDTMKYDSHYEAIVYMVLGELQKYVGKSYTTPFVDELDYQRLGIAIQRAVLLQQIHEIAQVLGGTIPEAKTLFPGMTVPELSIKS